jgi:hypothetical protein
MAKKVVVDWTAVARWLKTSFLLNPCFVYSGDNLKQLQQQCCPVKNDRLTQGFVFN